jgi:hypothetical protein
LCSSLYGVVKVFVGRVYVFKRHDSRYESANDTTNLGYLIKLEKIMLKSKVLEFKTKKIN